MTVTMTVTITTELQL